MAVPSTVELIVKVTNAVNPLRQVSNAANKASQSFEKTQNVLKKVTAASREVKASVEATQKSLPKLSQVQGVLAAKVRNSEQAMRSQIKALRDLQVRVKFNGSLYNKLGAEIDRFEAKLRSANGTTDQAVSRNRGLAAGLGKLVVAFGLVRAAQATLQAGIRRDDSERRLRLLTQRFGETAQAQDIARRAAEKFNLSQTEANVQLSRLIARLRPMGLSMQTIETAFAGFNTATILAGATASESAGAFLQLSQALGSGVLRGQELNSVLEQAPLIAQAIATEMGTTVGALKKFGEEGQITSEIVIAALGRVEREGAGQLAEALESPSAKIKAFQNAVQDAQVAISESSVPAIADSMKELGTVIRQLEPAIKFIGELLAGVAKTVGNIVENISTGGALAAAQKAANEAATLQARNKFGPFAREGITPGFKEFRDEVLKRELARRLAIARGAVPGQLPASAAKLPGDNPDTGGRFKVPLQEKGGQRKSPAERAREQAEATIQGINRQIIVAQGLTTQEKNMLKLKTQIAEAEENRALVGDTLTDQLINRLETLYGTEQVTQSILDLNKSQKQQADDANKAAEDALTRQQQEAQRLNQLFGGIGQTISSGIVDALMNAQNATQALGGMLQEVGKQLLQLGINTLLKAAFPGSSLFSGLLGFANGGRPPVGRPSVVGERGPELFVPDRAGTILPNGVGMGGTTITVNVDASETSADASSGSGAQLGKAIGLAVQQELLKQKRPGGLLAGV